MIGLRHASQYPEAKGQVHAIVGIVIGGLVSLGHLALVALGGIGAVMK